MKNDTPLVACEALLLGRDRVTGVERYTADILCNSKGPYELIVGPDSPTSKAVRESALQRGWPVTQLTGSSLAAHQIGLGWYLRTQRPRLHGVHHFSLAPGLLTDGRPFTLTIYDVGAWRFPHTMSRGMRYLYRPLIERALTSPRLRGIVTISRFSQEEIASVLNVPTERIEVVYPTLSYLTRTRPQVVPNVSQPFYLHVGTIEPRKNIEMLFAAFQRAGLPGSVLCLVGRQGWQSLGTLPSNVIHLPHVGDRELAWLYQHAVALVSASHYEGVGLPPAEALTAGCRVFLRDIPVYRELYGMQPNCWIFKTEDDLSELMRFPPGANPGTFQFPMAKSFDEAVECLHS